MQHLSEFKCAVLDERVMRSLQTHLVGIETVREVVPSDEAATRLIENEDKAAYLLLTESQTHLTEYLAEIVGLHVIFVSVVCYSKDRLWSNAHLFKTSHKKPHYFYLSLECSHLPFPLLLLFGGLVFEFGHDSAGDVNVIASDGDAVELFLVVLVLEF